MSQDEVTNLLKYTFKDILPKFEKTYIKTENEELYDRFCIFVGNVLKMTDAIPTVLFLINQHKKLDLK